MIASRGVVPPSAPPSLAVRRLHHHGLLWQVAAIALVAVVGTAVTMQTVINLRQRGIASGFAYLSRSAGFDIPSASFAYSARDTYARALAVGVFNTLRITTLGIVCATGLGLLVGAARLSRIWIASTTARWYVEVMRNTPLLAQLLFWYALLQSLPDVRHALQPISSVFLCERGLFLPTLGWHAGALGLDRPVLTGFGFRGGTSVSPEFAALLIGLSTYTAAFIGEIVRGGVNAVDPGQTEAAAALGLSRGRILRLVVFPQALPVIVPPTTSQFLSLAKNSSLAVAIGYPDLIAITNSTLNQTGQAIEAISVAMVCYLGISAIVSLPMTIFNRVVMARGRAGSAA